MAESLRSRPCALPRSFREIAGLFEFFTNSATGRNPREFRYDRIMSLETWEMLSYIVTVVGLPLAIFVFLFEQRKERENEEAEVYQLLANNETQ